MEKDLLDNIEQEQGKVYSIKTIVFSAFFAGILASGFMIYKNYKTFGDIKKANRSLFCTILLLILIISTMFVPALEKVPGFFYSILLTLGTSIFVNRFQRDLVNNHVSKGGRLYETGNVVAVCIVSILIIVGLILVPFFLQDFVFN